MLKTSVRSRFCAAVAFLTLLAQAATAAVYTVTNTNDSGPGSFRQAVIDSNLTVGGNEIVFNIDGDGPHTITLQSQVNLILSTEVLGESQPGYAGTPLITFAPPEDPAQQPESLISCEVTVGGSVFSALRFEGGTSVTNLLKLNTVGSMVRDCDFDGKGFNVAGVYIGGTSLNNAIQDSTFRNCYQGISQFLVGAGTSISGCDIRNNGFGILINLPVGLQALTQTATITDNVIRDNWLSGVRNTGGILSRVLIRRNSIYNNGQLGIDNAEAGVNANNNDQDDDVLGGNVLDELVGALLNGQILGNLPNNIAGEILDGVIPGLTTGTLLNGLSGSLLETIVRTVLGTVDETLLEELIGGFEGGRLDLLLEGKLDIVLAPPDAATLATPGSRGLIGGIIGGILTGLLDGLLGDLLDDLQNGLINPQQFITGLIGGLTSNEFDGDELVQGLLDGLLNGELLGLLPNEVLTPIVADVVTILREIVPGDDLNRLLSQIIGLLPDETIEPVLRQILGGILNDPLGNPLDDLGLVNVLLGGTVNHPTIESTEWVNDGLRVTGTVNTFPLLNVDVDFYLSPQPDPTGYGEGKMYVGNINVQTDLNGLGEFDDVLPVTFNAGTQYLTATTNINGVNVIILQLQLGEGTSEFSPAFAVDGLLPNTEFGIGWNRSGLDSGPEYGIDPTTVDDVDLQTTTGELQVTVRPSAGRYRIAGFVSPPLLSMDAVSPNQFVRGKFYIYATNETSAPLNEVPNFRIRLQNEDSVLASAAYSYAQTGQGGVPHEPFYDTVNNPQAEVRAGGSLRPSPEANQPSLYRIDFDPINVPAAAGTNIHALFESYSVNNPANGTLALTECVVATYPTPTNGEQIFGWSNLSALAATNAIGGTKTAAGGGFNAEDNFEAGRRQDLEVPTLDPNVPVATVSTISNGGVLMDTAGVASDKFGVGVLNIFTNEPAQAPRLEANRIYRARFLVSSVMPTAPTGPSASMQGNVFFGINTGLGTYGTRLEVGGPAHYALGNQPNAQLSSQAMPGIGTANPDTAAAGLIPSGEAGGWYTVQMSSPMDADIMHYTDAPGSLANEPGPEVDALSARTINLDVTVLQVPRTLQFAPNLVLPAAAPNRAMLRVLAAELYKYPQVNDGGYAYSVDPILRF